MPAPFHVLIIEDNEDHQVLIKIAFNDLVPTASVVPVSSAEEGIAYLSGGSPRPDLILVDLGLPGISGLDFIRRLRADYGPDTPVLAMTAAARWAPQRRLCLREGADEFVEKPEDFEDLVRVALSMPALDRDRSGEQTA